MIVSARQAGASDLGEIERLYRNLETEMVALHEMWPIADALSEPVSESLAGLLEDPEALVIVGAIDGYPIGFLIAVVEDLLPQARGERIGSIRFVFTDHGAREVGVGEEMRDLALAELGARGLTRFDAHVLPGHRLVKNFFESGGFSARSIVMHHRSDE